MISFHKPLLDPAESGAWSPRAGWEEWSHAWLCVAEAIRAGRMAGAIMQAERMPGVVPYDLAWESVQAWIGAAKECLSRGCYGWEDVVDSALQFRSLAYFAPAGGAK